MRHVGPFPGRGGKGQSMSINDREVGQRMRSCRQELGINVSKAAFDLSIRFASDPTPGVLAEVKNILMNEATHLDKSRQNLQR